MKRYISRSRRRSIIVKNKSGLIEPSLIVSIFALTISILFTIVGYNREDKKSAESIKSDTIESFYSRLEKISDIVVRNSSPLKVRGENAEIWINSVYTAVNNFNLDRCLNDLISVNYDVNPNAVFTLSTILFSYYRWEDSLNLLFELDKKLPLDDSKNRGVLYMNLMVFYSRKDTNFYDSEKINLYFEKSRDLISKQKDEAGRSELADLYLKRCYVYLANNKSNETKAMLNIAKTMVEDFPSFYGAKLALQKRIAEMEEILEGRRGEWNDQYEYAHTLLANWSIVEQSNQQSKGEFRVSKYNDDLFSFTLQIFNHFGDLSLIAFGRGKAPTTSIFSGNFQGQENGIEVRGVVRVYLEGEKRILEIKLPYSSKRYVMNSN